MSQDMNETVGDILVSVGLARGRMTSLTEQTIKAVAELNEVSYQTVTAAITQTNKAVTDEDVQPVIEEVDEGPPLVEVGVLPPAKKRKTKKKPSKEE